MGAADTQLLKQHLIDPEICIRCNTCEATCPVGAITHDDNNYVVNAEICNACMACISPCPTGSIDNWRQVLRSRAYTVEEQLGWTSLPAELDVQQLQAGPEGGADDAEPDAAAAANLAPAGADAEADAAVMAPTAAAANTASATNAGSQVPPWSAAHPYLNLYGPKAPQTHALATVTGNARVTELGSNYDTHHIVLDFGDTPFPVLEGQSIGIVAPGVDAKGRAHHPRQYSVASPRNGERPGYNNLSLTVKRVLEDHHGRPVRGVVSNYLCDLKVGDQVHVTGPFGASFLMPNHAGSRIVMICTGTGSAPMRAMTEWRRRQQRAAQAGMAQQAKPAKEAKPELLLFFGARSPQELPYFGPLQNLPAHFIDIHFAFSRVPGQDKRYVQDLMREQAAVLAPMLADPNTCFYVCGLRAMEEGVVAALRDIACGHGMSWAEVSAAMKQQGRLHLETY
jgi:benzoyl-CoA 2,3-epoxidase subunit A